MKIMNVETYTFNALCFTLDIYQEAIIIVKDGEGYEIDSFSGHLSDPEFKEFKQNNRSAEVDAISIETFYSQVYGYEIETPVLKIELTDWEYQNDSK